MSKHERWYDPMRDIFALLHILAAWTRRTEGQTIVEYAFLIAFIAAVVLVAVTLLGVDISSVIRSVATSI